MLIRLLVGHLRRYRRLIAGVLVCQLVQTTATLTLPTLMADIIDRGVIRGDVGFIWRTGAEMLALTAVQIVFAVGAVALGARVAMGFGRDVRNELFGRVMSFSAREVGRFGAPSLITRITNDVTQVQMLVVMGATMLVTAPLTMAVGVVMALREDVDLSVVLVVTVPVAALVLGNIVRRMVPAYQAMQEHIDDVNRILREQITGIRVIRAFVREPVERERFAQANAELTAVSLRAGRLMASMFPTVTLLINVSSVGVLWMGAGLVDSGQLQLGSLIAYLSYLVQILIAVVMSTFMLSMIPRAAVAAERVQEVLDTTTSVVPPTVGVRELPEPGTVTFEDVSFRYPGATEPVLAGIDLVARAGQVTAVIGSTGAGKSTLLGMVARLYDATGGRVLVGGVDVRDLDPEILGSRIGYVPQRAYLFAGTVASNLADGKPDATPEEMWEALEIAQAAEFVREMGGLDAPVTQGGTNLSGGQRQRLSIARAVVRRPDVYLFDDSFSALDMATDARLRAALRPVTADAVVITVAQRVATILDAEQILVLEHGRIVGRGTHPELLASSATYREIVESQLGQGALA